MKVIILLKRLKQRNNIFHKIKRYRLNNYMTTQNLHHYSKHRKTNHMAYWLHQFIRPNFFVTLAFNDTPSVEAAKDKLKKWSGDLDRNYLGPKFHKKPIEDRTFFIAFPEHLGSNFHYHLLAKIDCDRWLNFRNDVDECWNDNVQSGTTDTKLIYNLEGCIRYISKDVHKSINNENYIISDEFITHSKRR